MRAFIALCLIAAVSADKLGYNYHPVEHSNAGLSFVPGGAATNVAPSYAAPVEAASAAAPSFSAPAGVNKEFYSFSANDEDFLEPAASNQVDNIFNQNLRVIFIKGPEQNGLEEAALALAKQASQQQTAIYVLNKQADLNDLAGKLKNLGDHSRSKPEVHFVKYRTPEDAANAQRAIQSQYDSLGGPSQSHNGGVASAINFASAPAPVHHAPAAATPQASYLPASIFRRFRL